MSKGSSSQSSSSSTATSVTDNRVGVADDGVYADDSVVQQGNDFRSFDDHSVFSVETTDNSDHSDRRTFDDHSVFSVSNTDSRDQSDHSVTNITTLDADLAKAAIEGNVAATKNATEQGTKMLEAVLKSGEAVTSDAFKFSNGITEAGFTAVTDANKRSLDFAAASNTSALDFGSEAMDKVSAAGSNALDFASSALGKAIDAVTKSAEDDRAFASEFTGRIFDTAKSADQANVEKIVKAVTITIGIAAAAWAARSIFGKSKA